MLQIMKKFLFAIKIFSLYCTGITACDSTDNYIENLFIRTDTIFNNDTFIHSDTTFLNGDTIIHIDRILKDTLNFSLTKIQEISLPVETQTNNLYWMGAVIDKTNNYMYIYANSNGAQILAEFNIPDQ